MIDLWQQKSSWLPQIKCKKTYLKMCFFTNCSGRYLQEGWAYYKKFVYKIRDNAKFE